MKGKIFNAQEVQAMLNGSKVMFREVIKPQPFQSNSTYQSLSVIRDCPYQVGQKIFCKESFRIFDKFDCWNLKGASCKCSNHLVEGLPIYAADQNCFETYWKPAQHMKQEHSRLTLLIKEIRGERLGDISEEDALKEGVMNHLRIVHYNPVEYFRQLWNATHKKPEEKFEASPFVWCVNFEVINN